MRIGPKIPTPQAAPEPAKAQAAKSEPASRPVNGQRVGVRPYLDSVVGKLDPEVRADLESYASKIDRYTDAAVAYARLGKTDLAKRALADAKEYLGLLEEKAAPVAPDAKTDMHLGLWKQKGESPVILAARQQVEAAAASVAGAKPVESSEPAPWKKLVVLFGSSANPPTGLGGHAGIVKWCANELSVDVRNDLEPTKAREDQRPDEVWVLPVYKHIYAEKSGLLSFEHRFEMAKRGFENLEGLGATVRVVDAERQLSDRMIARAKADGTPLEKVRAGSIDLVEMLKEQYPDHQFVLMFGGDTFLDYKKGKWKGGRALEDELPLVAIPRAGVDGVSGSEENAPKLSDISSTKVRESTDRAWLAEVLHPEVLAYMEEHGLYGFAKKDE